MPFVKKHGVVGLVFEPEGCPAGTKKHECPDCFYCQQCSDARCRACLKSSERKESEQKNHRTGVRIIEPKN